jgi:hypothetical protein
MGTGNFAFVPHRPCAFAGPEPWPELSPGPACTAELQWLVSSLNGLSLVLVALPALLRHIMPFLPVNLFIKIYIYMAMRINGIFTSIEK